MEILDTDDLLPGASATFVLDNRTTQTAGIVALLRDDSNRVLGNWVIHVANTPAFRAWRNLGLAELQDSVPELIEAILTAIRATAADHASEPVIQAIEVAASHGLARGQSGFPIAALLAEFKALREELGAALHRAAGDDPAWHEATRELEARLNTTLDLALIEAAEGWVKGAFPRTADQ